MTTEDSVLLKYRLNTEGGLGESVCLVSIESDLKARYDDILVDGKLDTLCFVLAYMIKQTDSEGYHLRSPP